MVLAVIWLCNSVTFSYQCLAHAQVSNSLLKVVLGRKLKDMLWLLQEEYQNGKTTANDFNLPLCLITPCSLNHSGQKIELN